MMINVYVANSDRKRKKTESRRALPRAEEPDREELNTIRVPRGGDEVLTLGNQGRGNVSKAMGTDETLGTLRMYGNSGNEAGGGGKLGNSYGTRRESSRYMGTHLTLEDTEDA